ncbi:unnamed protein product [Mesocestoides corti]|uniref:Uncharacterized protein n=1 Tax=Mesocestoides corti TaxID=53468 RepID=A0A0R3U7Q8_MESCO|nr:unnamed protein product [Mesocestoides corti]
MNGFDTHSLIKGHTFSHTNDYCDNGRTATRPVFVGPSQSHQLCLRVSRLDTSPVRSYVPERTQPHRSRNSCGHVSSHCDEDAVPEIEILMQCVTTSQGESRHQSAEVVGLGVSRRKAIPNVFTLEQQNGTRRDADVGGGSDYDAGDSGGERWCPQYCVPSCANHATRNSRV